MTPHPIGLYAVFLPDRNPAAKVRAFIDFNREPLRPRAAMGSRSRLSTRAITQSRVGYGVSLATLGLTRWCDDPPNFGASFCPGLTEP